MTSTLELLNPIARSTAHERAHQRQEAIRYVRGLLPEFAADRLEGKSTWARAGVIDALRDKYKITDEELNGE